MVHHLRKRGFWHMGATSAYFHSMAATVVSKDHLQAWAQIHYQRPYGDLLVSVSVESKDHQAWVQMHCQRHHGIFLCLYQLNPRIIRLGPKCIVKDITGILCLYQVFPRIISRLRASTKH